MKKLLSSLLLPAAVIGVLLSQNIVFLYIALFLFVLFTALAVSYDFVFYSSILSFLIFMDYYISQPLLEFETNPIVINSSEHFLLQRLVFAGLMFMFPLILKIVPEEKLGGFEIITKIYACGLILLSLSNLRAAYNAGYQFTFILAAAYLAGLFILGLSFLSTFKKQPSSSSHAPMV